MSSSPSAALVAPSFEGDFSPGEAFSLEAGGVLASPPSTMPSTASPTPRVTTSSSLPTRSPARPGSRIGGPACSLTEACSRPAATASSASISRLLLRLHRAGFDRSAHRQPLRPELSPGQHRRHRHLAGAPAQRAQHPSPQAGDGGLHRRHAGPGAGDPVSGTGRTSHLHRRRAPGGDGPGPEPSAAADDPA